MKNLLALILAGGVGCSGPSPSPTTGHYSGRGGMAFPIKDGNNGYIYGGMSRRDYFAAHAPPVPEDWGRHTTNEEEYGRLIEWRWQYADYMIAREPSPPGEE